MSYSELLRLYFDRTNATQWYWTLYVVIIGGLLAFSSLRKRPDVVSVVLITVLYACFACKNAGAIIDVTNERFALIALMKEPFPTGSAGTNMIDSGQVREQLEPRLNPTPADSARNFHIGCDVLTIAALWAMEWRRRRAWRETSPVSAPV
jgi:hypothetical protein